MKYYIIEMEEPESCYECRFLVVLDGDFYCSWLSRELWFDQLISRSACTLEEKKDD